jgi:hypothetical protein
MQARARESVVVKALSYKPEGRGFEIEFISNLAAVGPGVHAASDRNENKKQENNVPGE